MTTPREHFKEVYPLKLTTSKKLLLDAALCRIQTGNVVFGVNLLLNEILEDKELMYQAVVYSKKMNKTSFKKIFGCIYIKRKEN